jgi:hypothetical protein
LLLICYPSIYFCSINPVNASSTEPNQNCPNPYNLEPGATHVLGAFVFFSNLNSGLGESLKTILWFNWRFTR